MSFPVAVHRAQLEVVLTAWGMSRENATTTADVLAWADVHGVDGHGMSMLPQYDAWRRAGRVDMRAVPTVVRETAVSALLDGGGGLGHFPAQQAMSLAVNKAQSSGIAIISVRNSAHFGACGYYGAMAAEAGLVGMVCTSASAVRVAPTGGAEPRFGTDPWCFAAPAREGRPFLLDMATTTVALGRVRNKATERAACPDGWILGPDGLPSRDPLDLLERGGFLTSLGGSSDTGSYKGYGLSTMVNILSSCLSGTTLVTDPMHTRKPQGLDIGHFFLAMDPGLFRDRDEFRDDVIRLCDDLRSTRPVDPEQPVMVAGDPQWDEGERRTRDGIPVSPGLVAQVQSLAESSGAPWLLG